MENNPTPTPAEQLRAARAAAAEQFDAFKLEADEHLSAIANHLDALKDKFVARAQEVGRSVDTDALKAQAAEQLDTAKATATETLSNLQAQAQTTYAAAAAKADQLADVAEDKLDDMRAEAAVQLQAAQVKLNELKGQAVVQVEAAKQQAQDLWHRLFSAQ